MSTVAEVPDARGAVARARDYEHCIAREIETIDLLSVALEGVADAARLDFPDLEGNE